VVRVGDLTIDKRTLRVRIGGRERTLSAHQFRLLMCLALRANQLVPIADIGQAIWGQEKDYSAAAVRVEIHRLRKVIGQSQNVKINTIVKLGYLLRTLDSLTP